MAHGPKTAQMHNSSRWWQCSPDNFNSLLYNKVQITDKSSISDNHKTNLKLSHHLILLFISTIWKLVYVYFLLGNFVHDLKEKAHTSIYTICKTNSNNSNQRAIPLPVGFVKWSSKTRSSIYKFEFEFSFLAFAIRFVIVPQGRAFNKLQCIAALSTSVTHGCTVRTLHRRPAKNTVM